jgi:membrane protein
MGMVFAMAFLIAVSLVLSTVVATLGKWWGAYLGGWTIVALVLDFAISFGMLTAIFALIYKVMPRAKVEWHDVWIGAATTAVLFTIGKVLIGLYLGKTAVASSYGAAGSIVVLLLWVYYSAQIFLLGAEFTWVYARTFGSMRERADNTAAAKPARIPASRQTPPATAVVPAPQLQPPGTTRTSRNTLIGLGLGIAAVLSVRFLMPRMLGRSSPSSYLW